MDKGLVKAANFSARLFKVRLLLVLLLLGAECASATQDLRLNIFPTIGKPIYGVAEFLTSTADPLSVSVASEVDYEALGYIRPAFLDGVIVRKMSTSRYLIKSKGFVDMASFAIILDVKFENYRRIFPVELTVNSGEVAVNYKPVIDTQLVSKKLIAAISQPKLASAYPLPEEINLPKISVANKEQSKEEPIVQRMLSAPHLNHSVSQSAQSVDSVSTGMRAQPPIFYPPIQLQAQPIISGVEQYPFYLTLVVLSVFIIVAMFVVVLFMHKNQDSRYPMPSHEHSLLSDLLKTMLSRPNNAHHQSPASSETPGPLPVDRQEIYQPARVKEKRVKKEGKSKSKSKLQASGRSSSVKSDKSPAKPVSTKQASLEPRPAPSPAIVKPSAPALSTSGAASSSASSRVQTSPSKQQEKPSAKTIKRFEKSEKLQLAIVYMNMGDDSMARMLLEEITRDGADAEKSEAREILAKMNSRGDRPIIAETNDNKE